MAHKACREINDKFAEYYHRVELTFVHQDSQCYTKFDFATILASYYKAGDLYYGPA